MDFLDFENLQRPGSPNTFLVAPEGLCRLAGVDAPAPRFAESPKALFALLTRLVRSGKRVRDMLEDPKARRLRYVEATPLLGFRDDVDIVVLPVDGGEDAGASSTLAIYSRSRVGYSDLGANAKRVRRLLESLSAATKAP